MSITLYRVSAFPNKNIGGNEAGVVLFADELSEQQMLSMAARVNFSETAFVLKSDLADFKLRYFSPIVEVPLCGHATIATFNLMRNLDMLDKKHLKIETNEGILDMHIDPSRVRMQLKKPKYLDTLTKKELCEALNLNESILLDYPIQVVSTGIKELFFGVKSLKDLNTLSIPIKNLVELSKQLSIQGVYVYTLETLEGGDAQGRNFLPILGIPEESATGTASGALACYYNKYINPEKTDFFFEQGYVLHKPSRIYVTLNKEEDKISDVFVGGSMRLIDKIIGFKPEN